MRLTCKPVPAQTFLQAKLHKNSETHLLAMENVVTSLQLGEAVVNGMGRDSAATGAAKPPHHPGGESTGFGGAHPGRTVWIFQSREAVDQQLIPQHPSHLHGLLHQTIAAVAATH
jgi:hypothetical protein